MSQKEYPLFPVLLIDDEPKILDNFVTALLTGNITNVIRCQDSRDVKYVLSQQDIEVILLDLMMPNLSGKELLSIIIQEFPEIPVIIITGSSEVETAVSCMKIGAFDYMVKPVEKSKLISVVKRAIQIRELQRENRLLKDRFLSDQVKRPDAFSEIITRNKAMQSIFQYVEAISISQQPLLITGETGTGKELIAKAAHTLSNRPGNFVAVNIAGLDENVFSDTLFGHRKGAFTGADKPRGGMIEQASEGTLFLDEIGDLNNNLQVKILRLLNNGEYYPLGSDVAKQSDARIVVATNQDIHVMQESGSFRKDLYYRLLAHHVHLPPLRDRKDDLPILLAHFLEKASKALDVKQPTTPKELDTLLGAYLFPGNIRELGSMIFDAVSLHESGQLSLQSIKAHIQTQQYELEPDLKQDQEEDHSLITFHDQLPTLKQAEQRLISEALCRANGNQSIAAIMLGISRQALNQRIKRAEQQRLPK